MSPSPKKLKNPLSPDQLDQILELSRDYQPVAFEALSAGRKIRDLKNYCRRVLSFEDRLCGCVSLDEGGQGKGALAETLAAPEIEKMERWRIVEPPEEVECVLARLSCGSAAQLGRSLGLTARRGQQIVAQLMRQATAARQFREGGAGQGAFELPDSEEGEK
jgi:hypothetical protein